MSLVSQLDEYNKIIKYWNKIDKNMQEIYIENY